MNKTFAAELSNAISSSSKKYGISSKVLTAVLMQESSYRVSAKNISCGVSVLSGETDCIAIDVGIGQINHKTVKSFNLDPNRLVSDLKYSVDASAMVLADFKRMYGSKDPEYWTRYNSSKRDKREVYKRLVSRYM